MARNALIFLGAILLLGGLHLGTLRSGQEWGDDFSLYLAHARNIAEGRPYADTGYVYNPADPVRSPRTYPPIFPLLLVPIYLLFGMNLTAMKVFVVLLFMVLLGVLAVLFQKRLPLPYVLGCLTLFALNPYVWQHKDRLLSEVPFMLFAYLALLLAEKAQQEQQSTTRTVILGLLAGAIAYLAFGTRTVGVVLIPSILAADWLRRRRWGIASLSIVASFTIGVIAQKSLLVLEGSYLDQLVFDPWLFAWIGQSLIRALGHFLENGYSDAARVALFACLLLPASWAYLARLRDRWTACEWFAAFNGMILVLWPAAEYDRRFLLPLLPLLFLYVGEGLHRMETTPMRRLEKPAAAVVVLAVLISYTGWYSRMELGPIRDGVSASDAVALFDWAGQHTDASDLFLFQRPRAFALFTRRRSLAPHETADHECLERLLREHDVTHVVTCQATSSEMFENSQRIIEPFLERNAERFEIVYVNPGFRVHRIRDGSLASR